MLLDAKGKLLGLPRIKRKNKNLKILKKNFHNFSANLSTNVFVDQIYLSIKFSSIFFCFLEQGDERPSRFYCFILWAYSNAIMREFICKYLVYLSFCICTISCCNCLPIFLSILLCFLLNPFHVAFDNLSVVGCFFWQKNETLKES